MDRLKVVVGKAPRRTDFVCAQMPSPIGDIIVTAAAEGVLEVDWVAAGAGLNSAGPAMTTGSQPSAPESHDQATRMAEWALAELGEYFAGKRLVFTVPVVLHGTEFQTAVWRALDQIPYGETRSYQAVARSIGRDQAMRAVGQANRRNPIAIIVPCHRVVGASGGMVGYAGDKVDIKARLLELERR